MNQLRPRPLVLIVDDELSARLIMRTTLEESGFDVVEAASVAEASVNVSAAQTADKTCDRAFMVIPFLNTGCCPFVRNTVSAIFMDPT